MHAVLQSLGAIGLIPVIKLSDPAGAVPLMRALTAGGIPTAEITFRTEGAERAIAAICQAMPDALVGAGTVVTTEQAQRAVEAGAKYIVSPGFDREIIEWCAARNIPMLPGCSTASEMEQAVKLGLAAVKFFPAEAAGGVNMLKALSGPFPGLRVVPTGGIGPGNLGGYLALPQVLACGGSWMAPDALIDAGDWAGVEALAQAAVRTMLDLKLAHVGINCPAEQAADTARRFSALLGLPADEIPVSYFVGEGVEVMKSMGRGTMGHLAISTADVDRAERYLAAKGFVFDGSSRKVDSLGRTTFLYIKDEIGGFAVHLVRS
ncbi:MAG: bifunctional 4-hydroxy-2-oxoglutarate aldolase/2-dehydro-3-deoxy-phosphogluconate aldolase [Clostridiales bacterium]|nr:bifunctional 4-hydroxy-2-oxoglutarate aldolase/2-dehydro-3-deoxy-phosphogluconate aldolase [Clostridiales bacterium]